MKDQVSSRGVALDIAVIGSGAAGATAALFLARDGHRVTVFERQREPKPVGAGVMLQPPGIQTLAELGLADRALGLGERIDALRGWNQDGKLIVDLGFDNPQNLFGLGIQRGALYFLLFDELGRRGIPVRLGVEVDDVRIEGQKAVPLDTEGEPLGGFDLVVAANGARSNLRAKVDVGHKDRPQHYGALWARIPYDNSVLENSIFQKYEGSHTMIGLMPMGRPAEDEPEEINFFWSMRADKLEAFSDADFEAWRDQVVAFCPEHRGLIEQIESPDQLMRAPYRDVELKPSYKDRVVFIGDAAHPMSPQLAQGTGFAMLDARMLCEQLAAHGVDVPAALRAFHKKRWKQVSYYQKLSRFVTPMFQSDRRSTLIRDLLMRIACGWKIFRGLMVGTILGYRENPFRNIESRYYLGRG